MSPDGRNLALQAETLAERRNVMHHDLIIMNMQSLAMTTWHVDLPLPITRTMTTFISLYQWSSDNQNIIFFSGEVPASDEWFGTPLGALYTLNINTGQTAIFSGKHIINGWIVSPIAVSP